MCESIVAFRSDRGRLFESKNEAQTDNFRMKVRELCQTHFPDQQSRHIIGHLCHQIENALIENVHEFKEVLDKAP
jgi:hypothetical protein